MMRTATVFAALFTGAQAYFSAEDQKEFTDMLSKFQDGNITKEDAQNFEKVLGDMLPKTEKQAQELQEDLMSMLLSSLPEEIKSNMEQLQQCLERVKTLSSKDSWKDDFALITETASVLEKSMIAMDLPEKEAENIAAKGAPIALFLSAVTGITTPESAGDAEAMNNLTTKIFAHMSSGHQNTETMIESVKESLSDAKEMLEVVMRKYKTGTSQGMAFLATEAENAMKSILDQTSEDMAENLQLVFGNATQIPMGKLKVEEIADTINNMFTGAIDAEDQQEDVEVN